MEALARPAGTPGSTRVGSRKGLIKVDVRVIAAATRKASLVQAIRERRFTRRPLLSPGISPRLIPLPAAAPALRRGYSRSGGPFPRLLYARRTGRPVRRLAPETLWPGLIGSTHEARAMATRDNEERFLHLMPAIARKVKKRIAPLSSS